MNEHLRFQVLGELRAQRDGVELDLGGARQRRVLAVLLLSLGRPIPAERLAELVWGDEAPASVRLSLQSYISKLRTALEPDRRPGAASTVIGTRAGGYVLDVEPTQVDLARAELAVAEARSAHATGRSAEAIGRLAPVLAGWSTVLPEFRDAPVVVAAARRSEAVRAMGTEVLARARLAVGDHHGAVVDLRTAVADDPRAEAAWALLALALYRCGRQAEAIDAVASARRILRQECGLEVGDELRRLEADLLAQAPRLRPPTAAAVLPRTDPTPDAPRGHSEAARGTCTRRPPRSAPARRCAQLSRPR